MRHHFAWRFIWRSQNQSDLAKPEDSVSYKKFLPGKIITYMEMIGISPWYSTMKCQLQSMSGTSAKCKLQSKINFRYPTYHEISVPVNTCQVPYLEMLGTCPTAGIHETVRYWNVIYTTRSRYGWNNTGSLVVLWPVHIACSKHF